MAAEQPPVTTGDAAPHVPAGSPAPRDPLQAVISDVESLDTLDPAGQVEVYERIHAALLAALDTTTDAAAGR